MTEVYEGNAVVYCEGAFQTTNGKTAHGLTRRSRRYKVVTVIDSTCSGRDADEILVGAAPGIPIVGSLEEALAVASGRGAEATHLVIGLAPDGGRLPDQARLVVRDAIGRGLNVVSGLHDFLTEDDALTALAAEAGVTLFDIRRPPPRSELHFFSGVIEQVESVRVALLGTDSAVGKRTTAWLLVDALNSAGHSAELIGTGQTAWLQGARYSMILDSVVNDFLTGEIEHAIWSAWSEVRPAAMVLEGQGSLLNPAYPGGYELLAAGRPHAVVLQHAPARRDYDGFPGYPIQPLGHQVQAIEVVSGKPVVAVTVNAEGLDEAATRRACEAISAELDIPAVEPLRDGIGPVVEALRPWLDRR